MANEPTRDISEILSDPGVVHKPPGKRLTTPSNSIRRWGCPWPSGRTARVAWVAAEELERRQE